MKADPLFVCATVLFAVTASFADEGKGEGYGAFSTGLNLIDAGGLNRSAAFHKMEFRDQQWALGGLGFGVVGPGVILGGEGYGFSQETSSDTMTGTISGGYGFFNVGYQILRSRDFFAYPFLGIGGGGYTLRLVHDTDERDAETLIKKADRMVEIDRGGFLLELGFGLGYLIDLATPQPGAESAERGGIFLGLRAGYIFDPGSPNWKFEDTKLRGGPDLKSNAFFVTLQIGGGGGT